MMECAFTMTDEGDEFIRDQIRLKQDFFFFNIFIILGIVVATGYLKLKVIDRGAILFGFFLFLFAMAAHLRRYIKFRKLKAQLIRTIQIEDEKIILTTYRDDKYEPVRYTLQLGSSMLTKGILKPGADPEKAIQIEMLGKSRSYTLTDTANPKNTFYLMSSLWPQWKEMAELIRKAGKLLM